MTNKLKVVIIIVLIYITTLMTINVSAQGIGNGGPPIPPKGWCDLHPNDPACGGNAVQVPLSDWYWEIGLMLVGTAFIYYKFNKKTIA